MAKIKDIHKAQPEPIKGVWWHEITMDDGVTGKFGCELEEPFKVGEEVTYQKEEKTGRGGKYILFTNITPGSSPTAHTDDDVIRAAKARACIDAMGYAVSAAGAMGKKPSDIYPVMLKMIYDELNKL